MKIRQIKRYRKKVHKAVQRLLTQLDPDAGPISKAGLRSVIRSDNTSLFVAETDDGVIAGMLTAAVYITPFCTKFWIEDVVVDEAFRGKGTGKALMLRAIEYARIRGAGSVDLTSRPTREAANRLYQEIGFVKRETNVYRYDLKKSPEGDEHKS